MAVWGGSRHPDITLWILKSFAGLNLCIAAPQAGIANTRSDKVHKLSNVDRNGLDDSATLSSGQMHIISFSGREVVWLAGVPWQWFFSTEFIGFVGGADFGLLVIDARWGELLLPLLRLGSSSWIAGFSAEGVSLPLLATCKVSNFTILKRSSLFLRCKCVEEESELPMK